jgi:hypothetical protein
MTYLLAQYVWTMTSEGTASEDRYLTRQNFLQSYRYITVLGLATVVVTVLTEGIIPLTVSGMIIGCWLLMSLFVLAHFGIKNSTHGV